MEHNFGANVHIMNHPLLTHKISLLRDKHTGTNEFRQLVEEIAMLMGFEALSDLPTKTVELETPIETAMLRCWRAVSSPSCRSFVPASAWYPA